jgi:hypothetical protein
VGVRLDLGASGSGGSPPSTIAAGSGYEIEARRAVKDWIGRRFVSATYDHGEECYCSDRRRLVLCSMQTIWNMWPLDLVFQRY